MTHFKINSRTNVISLFVALPFLASMLFAVNLRAQDNIGLRLSAAATVGYAPVITHGTTEDSGVVLGVYGELEYGKAVGRLQFTKPVLNTFDGNNNRDGGAAYHGSLGYRLDVSDRFFVGLLLSGGATVIHYSTGFNGGNGDQFTNVSPQVGLNIAPAYQITDLLSIQAGLRYYKGFKAGDRGQASDLGDVSVALRISL